MQLITGQQEPNTVGIHMLMVAMILSRRKLSVQEKVKRVFHLVCYQVQPNRI